MPRRAAGRTVGRQKLCAFLKGPPERSQTWLAELVGVSQANISLWVLGSTRPNPHHRDALALIADIPTDDWLTPDELCVIGRAAAFKARTGTEG